MIVGLCQREVGDGEPRPHGLPVLDTIADVELLLDDVAVFLMRRNHVRKLPARGTLEPPANTGRATRRVARFDMTGSDLLHERLAANFGLPCSSAHVVAVRMPRAIRRAPPMRVTVVVTRSE